jgi:uncharacterized protein YqgV (UPF0045/DUF77 family)
VTLHSDDWVLVEIQCLPTPAGTDERPYAHVEAAIRQIQDADVRYEVGALGTTLEGPPSVIWPLLRRTHEACLTAGAASVITMLKLAQASTPDATPHLDTLVSDYREHG